MLETLLARPAKWIREHGPELDSVVCSRATLARNLADLPFPARCSQEEKRSVEERVLAALESTGLLATGQYCSFEELDLYEAQFLTERLLITPNLIEEEGPRGVYLSNDQTLSVMINETEHVQIIVLASGLQLQELWDRLGAVDDALANGLDYAFHERFGYLTASLDSVGSGLHVTAILHMPGLAAMNQVLEVEKTVRERGHVLGGLFGKIGSDPSQLFQLTNSSTLGQSEEELAYHTYNLVGEVIQREANARKTMLADGLRGTEDRVGRALGVARGARLLDLDESLSVLSSLRLGTVNHLVDGCSLETLSEVLLAAQPGHIQLKLGRDCDDLTLSIERADLFRARFS